MKNIDKLVNFSIKGIVDESSNLVRDLQYLADQMFKVAHLERYRHLNYRGCDFEFIHKTLEDRYTLLEDSYDMVGEYIGKLGYKVNVYSEQPVQDEKSLECPKACIGASVENMESVLNMMYTVLNDVDELDDSRKKIQLSGLESDFTALISKLDQSNWLFNSRIGEADVPPSDEVQKVVPIEEPGSLAHVVNEDIQYPTQISNEPQPEEVPQETGISVINPPESAEEVDPLGAKEPEPDHTNLFAGLYKKLRRYGRRIW